MRVVIADDSVLIRAGVAQVLTVGGFTVVAEVGDGDALLDAVASDPPDLVVVDVRMPPGFATEGLEAAAAIKRAHPEVAVLILSQWIEEKYARDLVAANPRGIGYLLKERVSDVDEFIDSAWRVARGGTALDPEVVSQLLARRGPEPLDALTPRERDVLALMAEGRSNVAITRQLHLSESTVAKHIRSIFDKLQLPDGDSDHRRVLAVIQLLAAQGS